MSTPAGTATRRTSHEAALGTEATAAHGLRGSHEDKLSRLGAMHVNRDDEGRTREDREREQKDGRPPPQGGMAGML
jgi:hypothetical protein